MIRAVRAVSLGATGLFAGFLVGILVFELSLRRFDGSVFAQTQQVTLIALPALATALLFPALIATGALGALRSRSRDDEFWAAVASFALLLVALIVTLVVNVPINLAEAGWDPSSPPSDWATHRDRWQIGHGVRTAAALLAFGSLAVVASRSRK